MKKESYINYINYTIDTYNKTNKKALLKLYEDEKIAKKREEQTNLFDKDTIDIDYNNIEKTIMECINSNTKAIEIYEKYQFTKSYKYAVLCKCEQFDDLLKKIEKIEEYKYNDEVKIYDVLKEPTKVVTPENIIIVFNKKFEAIHPQTADELLLHYPIAVVIHLETKLVELRFDTIKRVFTEGERDQAIYMKQVSEVLDYLKKEYNIELKPLELDFILEFIKDDNDENIKLVSQCMNMANGSKAQLMVGNNEEYVLPIIGELKNIISELREELDKNLKIKDALEQFIYEKEETTDYPWIELVFLNEEGIKTRNNNVKFTFNYMNQNYTLITYYYNNTLIGMERMNDVSRFIGENIKE